METWNLPGPGEHSVDFFLPEGNKIWPMDTLERERERVESIHSGCKDDRQVKREGTGPHLGI